MPPLTVTFINPLASPLQKGSLPELEVLKTGGSEIVKASILWQPFASVTVTSYEPCTSPFSILFAPLVPDDQLYVNGATPSIGFAVAEPVASPLQATLVAVTLGIISFGSVTTSEEEMVQPLLSVTKRVYVPSHNPEIEEEVEPVFQA